MKKLIYLVLLVPFISFSQNDFRKMNWGESSKILKEKYSETSFQRDVLDEDRTVFFHTETVSGIDTKVFYVFTSDKFYKGMYLFEYNSYSRQNTDYLKDYINVSETDVDKLEYYCRNCGNKDDANDIQGTMSVSKVQFVNDVTNMSHIINKYTNKVFSNSFTN